MDDREAACLYKLAADPGIALAQVSLAAFYETQLSMSCELVAEPRVGE
jgi:TPR repeat protein